LVDRAGNSHEWDSDSASDSDDDTINDDENSDVTEEELFDLLDAKSSEVRNSGWLLYIHTGTSIKAGSDACGSVQKEQPCDVTMRIADGNSIKPRGVGTTTTIDHATGFPLPIKKMHGTSGRGARSSTKRRLIMPCRN
jgi:hypothetical protein